MLQPEGGGVEAPVGAEGRGEEEARPAGGEEEGDGDVYCGCFGGVFMVVVNVWVGG